MILTCPECATSYFVDDARVPAAGRTVKCSHCGAKWTAQPEGAAPPEPPPAAAPPPVQAAPQAPAADDIVVEGPETAADEPVVPRLASAAPRPRADGKVWIWAVSAGAIVALVAGVLVFRGPIVRMWPASGVAYKSLGVPVNDVGLVIEAVRAEPAFQGGRPVLSVTGQIRNIRDEANVAPALRVSLLDAKGQPLAAKVAQPINGRVPAGGVRHFAIAIVDPPANVKDLEVDFDAGGKGRGKPVRASAAPAGPDPVDAKPLPPGSPDALPAPPHD